jgi:hypothetical protein
MSLKLQLRLKQPEKVTKMPEKVATTEKATTEKATTEKVVSHENLPPIATEQLEIIQHISQGDHVCVDAVAGSGKTTTSLYLALNNADKSVLLLTYNAKLKLETRSKADLMNLTNLEIHSYHSFCVKYFYRRSYTDSGIITYLKTPNSKPLQSFYYDLIIVDEAQDMNPLYYEVVQNIIHEMQQVPQLVVMGDRKQSIYAFNNADSRFLTLSTSLYPDPTRKWQKGTLSTSYRVTNQIANFINHCCKGALPIMTIKDGGPVRYLICDAFGRKPLQEINNYLRMGYQYADIFVLTPSVKSEQSPIRRLANMLTTQKIPIYVPNTDEEKLDEEVLKGKIVFSTFHQVKGLERPVVIVYNFDNSYFKYYARDVPIQDRDKIPNTLYVAITRAKEHLVVIHHEANEYLNFLRVDQLRHNCELVMTGFLKHTSERVCTKPRAKELHVTELVRYVPVEVIDRCMEYVKVECIGERDKISIPIKVQQNLLMEGVNEINGVAIPSYYEFVKSNQMTVYQHLANDVMREIADYIREQNEEPVSDAVHKGKCLLDDEPVINPDDELYESIKNHDNVPSSLLELITHWVCQKTGFDFKKKQITQFTWLTQEILDSCVERLDQICQTASPVDLEFEKKLITPFNEYIITGFADLYNTQTHELWELKVVNEIDNTHILQVAIYCWMIGQKDQVSKMSVYNIMTNLQYIVHIDPQHLVEIVRILVNHKTSDQVVHDQQEFIDRCQQIRTKVANKK